MTEQESLMRRIMAYRFALLELHLYLDSHPGDCEAAARMEEYRRVTNDLVARYEAAYGPLHESPKTASRWAWISDPWPWDL
jgi:spore coat protein JB